MKVVLVTTGQPSINPRVVKEADALQSAGHQVTVLYCFWIRWAEDADKGLLKEIQWKHQLIGGSPSKNKILYFFSRARFKINKGLNKRFGNRLLFGERSQARCFDELLKAAKSIKADWYIGHNLGALSIVIKAARFNKASAGFDFEDYHRAENDSETNPIKKRIVYLEEKYAPLLNYISTSSPLITKQVKQCFQSFSKPLFTLLNCFPVFQQPQKVTKSKDDNTLQLFWFSQTIGKNRGLEGLITALDKLNDNSIHLTLAGRCDQDMNDYIREHAINVRKNIHFAGIIQPEDLPGFAANFDVGLALEPGFSTNNNIALSNKIFTYLLAGNAIILSETTMQKSFNEMYRVGISFTINDLNALGERILYYKNTVELNKQGLYNYQLSQNLLNWEIESKKLLEIIS